MHVCLSCALSGSICVLQCIVSMVCMIAPINALQEQAISLIHTQGAATLEQVHQALAAAAATDWL